VSTDLARKLRREASPPERAVWRLLGQFRRRGINLRRQVQIGAYYADFACHDAAVVIEVDGSSHDSELAQSNDAVRDDYFRGRGYRVLRFTNSDALSNPEAIFIAIEVALTEPPQRASPPTRSALGLRPSSATLPATGEGEASGVRK
jgi:very-short-patch-repair endonuclease